MTLCTFIKHKNYFLLMLSQFPFYMYVYIYNAASGIFFLPHQPNICRNITHIAYFLSSLRLEFFCSSIAGVQSPNLIIMLRKKQVCISLPAFKTSIDYNYNLSEQCHPSPVSTAISNRDGTFMTYSVTQYLQRWGKSRLLLVNRRKMWLFSRKSFANDMGFL